MDREGEYCSALLLCGGPPASRPKRDLITTKVEFEGMADSPRHAYAKWATRVREHAEREGWMRDSRTELFPWITGFLEWFDNIEENHRG